MQGNTQPAMRVLLTRTIEASLMHNVMQQILKEEQTQNPAPPEIYKHTTRISQHIICLSELE